LVGRVRGRKDGEFGPAAECGAAGVVESDDLSHIRRSLTR
jgi:hypothetical protein